jgi:hypothetical protein
MKRWCLAILISLSSILTVKAQEYGKPDRDQPGDEMIQEYLKCVTVDLHKQFLKVARVYMLPPISIGLKMLP